MTGLRAGRGGTGERLGRGSDCVEATALNRRLRVVIMGNRRGMFWSEWR